MTIEGESIVVFMLEGSKYALSLSAVDRVVPSVAITPLPEAIPIILGVINYQSIIIPALNIRKRFHLLDREIRLADHLIIAKTSKRVVALLADEVKGVFEIGNCNPVKPEDISSSLKYVDGIIQMDDGLVIIHDLEKFLSLDEEEVLDDSIEKICGDNGKPTSI